MRVIDLSILDYRAAWSEQVRVHAEVSDGAEDAIHFVEHPPVITFGRRAADSASHLVASRELLRQRGVDVVESDRGGDITFHGPGQLVAYPIVRLSDYRLSVGAYVKALEHAVIDTLGSFDIAAQLDPGAIGIWTRMSGPPPLAGGVRGGVLDLDVTTRSSIPPTLPSPAGGEGNKTLAKICALGVRIKGGVSMHGVALNVSTDLSYFDLIVPCGLANRSVTSMQRLLGERCPSMNAIKEALAGHVVACLQRGARHNASR